MKLIRLISTGVLLLLFGTVAPAYARQDQHEHGDEGRPQKREHQDKHVKHEDNGRRQQDNNRGQQERAQHQQRDQEMQQARAQHEQERVQHERAQQQAEMSRDRRQSRDDWQRAENRPASPRRQQVFEPAQRVRPEEHRNVWFQARAHSWESEHRDWRARGGYHGYFIPQERFRVYFGPSHRFRVHRLPVIVIGGYPRFQYGGYWFALVDPWPEYWADDWYDRDDVYVDYFGDGYYLCNRRYPGTRIAVNIFVD